MLVSRFPTETHSIQASRSGIVLVKMFQIGKNEWAVEQAEDSYRVNLLEDHEGRTRLLQILTKAFPDREFAMGIEVAALRHYEAAQWNWLLYANKD